jgi:hypothetical protein
MTIEEKKFSNAHESIAFLEELAYKSHDFIFRGHSKESYLLDTTYKRHTTRPIDDDETNDFNEMIEGFRAGIAKIGINPFPDNGTRREWLEYARHHGLPTPALDFSYSPYVALFFAFNGARMPHDTTKPTEYVAVYAVDVNSLGFCWASRLHSPGSSEFDNARQYFLYERKDFLESKYHANTLKFLFSPGKYNHRMQRQMGCLLYDTINYPLAKLNGLDDLIHRHSEPSGSSHPTAYKVLIDKNSASEVLSRLELMNIGGASLLLDADGVAKDVINGYNYVAKTSHVHGLEYDSH